MSKKIIRNISALTMLILLMCKVSAFHVYSHQDTDDDAIENCTVCEAVLEDQTDEYSFQDAIILEDSNQVLPLTASFNSITQQFPTTELHFRLFGRPPPEQA